MKTEWHRWFAWYPVATFELGWVWLQVVNRKKFQKTTNAVKK